MKPLHQKESKTKLVMTFDNDWAPPFIIEYTLNLLAGIPITFFVTGKAECKALERIPNVELGIHPNFMPNSSHGSNRRQVLETVMKLIPDAKIVRSHNLFQDSTVLDLYVEFGINYDLSLFEYKNPSPKPFCYWNSLVRLPYNFEDCVPCLLGEDFAKSIPPWMGSASLLVCNFHPIHIYLNTESIDRYNALRKLGPVGTLKAGEIEPFINRETFGTRNIVIALLEKVTTGEMMPLCATDLLQRQGIVAWDTYY